MHLQVMSSDYEIEISLHHKVCESRLHPCDVKMAAYKKWFLYLAIKGVRHRWLLTGVDQLIVDNYSPEWRWLAVDIYQAAKWRGKYPLLVTSTEENSCFTIF